MKVQELFEFAVPRPVVVRPAPVTAGSGPRWSIKGGDDESILIASLKAFDEHDEADARLLAHAYNHFPALLKAAEEMLLNYAGSRGRLRAAVKAAQKVNV